MVKATAKFLVTVSAPNSSLIDVNRILLTDMNLQFNGRLPAAQLPSVEDLKKLQGADGVVSAGLGPGSSTVEPRDVGFPINVNSGPPTNVPFPIGDAGPISGGGGNGYDTGNPADAKGFITLVEAPTSTTLGGQFQIAISVRNDGKASAKFKARVAIESLGIVNEPTSGIVLKPGESGKIRKTMIMPPDAQTNKLYPATIELLKVTDSTNETTVKEDEEVSTIPGPNVAIPPSGTPGSECIIRNGIQYCKANAYQPGCIVEAGIVYCPTANLPAQCITRNNTQYCKSDQFTTGCIVENNTVYCPQTTPTPTPTNPCPTGQCKPNATAACRAVGTNEMADPTTGLCVPNTTTPPSPGCPPGHKRIGNWCIPIPIPVPRPNPGPFPPPGGPASIQLPSSVSDGDSFNVRGAGFGSREVVDLSIHLVWQSNNPKYNGKTYHLSRQERASSNGTWKEQLRTSEVPSGVTAMAVVTAKGRSTNRIASGQVRIT